MKQITLKISKKKIKKHKQSKSDLSAKFYYTHILTNIYTLLQTKKWNEICKLNIFITKKTTKKCLKCLWKLPFIEN